MCMDELKLLREEMVNLSVHVRVKMEQVRQALMDASSGSLGSSLLSMRDSVNGSHLGCFEAGGARLVALSSVALT